MENLFIYPLMVLVMLGVNLSYCDTTNTSDTSGVDRKSILDQLLDKYDARLTPTFQGGGSTNVTVGIFILSIDTISETNMDFAISMFLRQSWYDKRLDFSKYTGHSVLELDAETINKVWVPDLFISTEKKASVHDVTVPNKLMHVYPDGKIQYSLRLSATLKCNFDLRKFPMDHQHCVVEMESYGYTVDTMRFQWGENPISRRADMQIPQFYLHDLTTQQYDKIYYGVGYSCVRFDIFMDRSKGYYITQVYIPSFLIVFLSWVSFWLDIEAVPARISLGLLTVLTMTTQSAGARNNLPKVSYLKAIDVWMVMCLIFVFLALVEFAYVNVNSRVAKRRKLTSTGSVGKALGSVLAACSPASAQSPASSSKASVAAPSPDTSDKADKGKPTTEDTEASKETSEGNPLLRMRKPGAFAGLLNKAKETTSDTKATPSDIKETTAASEPDVEMGNGTKQKPKPSFMNLAMKAKEAEEPSDQSNTGRPELKRQTSTFADVVRKAQARMTTIVSEDREKARNADRVARVVFPLSFLILNIIYWCVYTFWEPTNEHLT